MKHSILESLLEAEWKTFLLFEINVDIHKKQLFKSVILYTEK